MNKYEAGLAEEGQAVPKPRGAYGARSKRTTAPRAERPSPEACPPPPHPLESKMEILMGVRPFPGTHGAHFAMDSK